MKTSNEKHAAVILKCLPRATSNRFLAALDPATCGSVLELMERTEVTTEKLKTAIALLEREGLDGTVHFPKTSDAHDSNATVDGIGADSPFSFLEELDGDILRRLLSQENTRDAATVLSTLPQGIASAVLKDFDPSKRVEIIRLIATLPEPDERELAELRFALRLRIQKLLREEQSDQQQDAASELGAGSEKEPRPYATLHQLSELSDKQIKKLLSRIDTSHLAPALKTLPIQLQRKVLRNMGAKPAAIVSREIVDVRIDEKHRIERSSRSVARAIMELKEK